MLLLILKEKPPGAWSYRDQLEASLIQLRQANDTNHSVSRTHSTTGT